MGSEERSELQRAAARIEELEQRLAAREVRDRLFEGVISRLPVIIFTVDKDGVVTESMGAGLNRLGLVDGELVGVNALSDFPEARDDLERALKGETRVYSASGVTESGPWHYLTYAAFNQIAGSGLIAFSIDVTDRVEAERAVKRKEIQMQEQLQQSQKLESLGLLAGGIAHDFNNLLMGILGNASLTRRKLDPEAGLDEELGDIETSAQRAAELCQQLLAYSGRGRFVVQPVDVSLVVEEMARLLEVSMPKGVALSIECEEGLPAVEADLTQLRQVVMNLVVNAAEAVGEQRGRVSIGTGVIQCDSDYLKASYLAEDLAPGTYVCVEVCDDGVGMDAVTRTQMFDPFFSTKTTGRGLGLAAVMGIVRGHGGALRVYSEPGAGTTMKMLLPATHQAAAVLDVDRRGEPEPVPRSTVLVVDDEEIVRQVARRILESEGHTVQVVPDGESAVELFSEQVDRFDLVLLDLTMPGINGDVVFRELRDLRPDVRVILSSGYNEQDTTSRFAGKGLAGFIQKPYSAQELIECLQKALVNRS